MRFCSRAFHSAGMQYDARYGNRAYSFTLLLGAPVEADISARRRLFTGNLREGRLWRKPGRTGGTAPGSRPPSRAGPRPAPSARPHAGSEAGPGDAAGATPGAGGASMGRRRPGQGTEHVVPVHGDDQPGAHGAQQVPVIAGGLLRAQHKHVGGDCPVEADAVPVQDPQPADLQQEAKAQVHAIVAQPQRRSQVRRHRPEGQSRARACARRAGRRPSSRRG